MTAPEAWGLGIAGAYSFVNKTSMAGRHETRTTQMDRQIRKMRKALLAHQQPCTTLLMHATPSHNTLLLIPINLQHFPIDNTAANHLFALPTAFCKLPAVKGTCMSLLLASAAPTHFPWPVTPLS